MFLVLLVYVCDFGLICLYVLFFVCEIVVFGFICLLALFCGGFDSVVWVLTFGVGCIRSVLMLG